jgi:hypothetical protein
MIRKFRGWWGIAALAVFAIGDLHAAKAPEKLRSPEHEGLVFWRNEWLSPEQVVERAKNDSDLATYVNKRKVVENNIASQFKLANWCQQKGLAEQERTHLTKVLDLEPMHAEARSRLGFTLVDGQWLSREEIQGAKQHDKLTAVAMGRYSKPLESIAASLASNDEKVRAAAKTRLMEIKDPAAMPIMEAALSNGTDSAGLALVDALSAMNVPEASIALSRIAVNTPSRDIRDAAVEKLKSTKPEFFVPTLLASISTPVESRLGIFETLDGRLIYRHLFFREGLDSRQLAVLDQVFRTSTGARVNDPDALTARAGEVAVATAQAKLQVEEMNDRIFKLLSSVSGLNLPAKPEVWWSWWNDVTETAMSEEKPIYRNYVAREFVVAKKPENRFGSIGKKKEYVPPPPPPPPRPAPHHDCLVAGTKILTLTGPQAVETIQAGDLVLSKNYETGELAYKPILRPTTRPAAPLIAIKLANETITASGGHLFWTAEHGWQRARQLQPGTSLKLLSGTAEIQAVSEADPEQTYNLIVADFHTYFVGASKVINHDNTLRQPGVEPVHDEENVKLSNK